MIQRMLAIWSLVPLSSKSSLNIWKFMVHVLLKPGLKNFEHYFASVWDECNCAVFEHSLGLEWKHVFQSCGHCWVFQICWHIEHSPFTASSLRIWNSSTGIPSPPLALFAVILPKAHLTSHSRMSGSRWGITPLWLSGLWRSFLYSSSVYSCHLSLISSASVAAAAAKLLQSYPTLCDPIDRSPPGSTFPGILQARTLEWVAISFSICFC